MKFIPSRFQADLILNALPGIGPITYKHLLRAFGNDIPKVFTAGEKNLAALPGIGENTAQKIIHWEKSFNLAREEKRLSELKINFIPFCDPRYPKLLQEIESAPIGIYALGNINTLQEQRTIAIVGTRKASLYGTQAALKISEELALAGWTSVSGFARGIDTAAHSGSLNGKGKTIAVLGNGVDIIYPAENKELYKKIYENQGTIISEFPLGRIADKRTFPQRNRLIAGLSAGMLVVESDEKGGSILSANFAADYGRTVFALPGRIDQPNSKGCHKLIREGATLATCAQEIIEELDSSSAQLFLPLEIQNTTQAQNQKNLPKNRIKNLPEAAQQIYKTLLSGETLSPDAIAAETQLPPSSISSNLMLLELENLIARKTDGNYEITQN